LFGHRKGAFTSATENHDGYLVAAAGGTLFLDEVAELPLGVQAKLLRFLESGEVLPIGASTPGRVNVRIVAATHRELRHEVESGRFRQDLYYRLNVVPLQLPPLRERQGDIPLLMAHFVSVFAERHGLASPRFSKAALKALKCYGWPGNVRELRNMCERLMVLLPGREITPENLPEEIRADTSGRQTSELDVQLPPEGLVLANVEESLIRQALQRARGNRSKAARLLGISRDTLLYRLKKFAIS